MPDIDPLPPHLEGRLWEVHAETVTGRTLASEVDDFGVAERHWNLNRGGDTGIYVLVAANNERLAKEAFRSDTQEEAVAEHPDGSGRRFRYFYDPAQDAAAVPTVKEAFSLENEFCDLLKRGLQQEVVQRVLHQQSLLVSDVPPDIARLAIIRARQIYASGSDQNIQIDGAPLFSKGTREVWVSAWLRVPNERLALLDDK